MASQLSQHFSLTKGHVMKAVGYIRVSTEEQAREGVSLDNQRKRIEAFCVAKDWTLGHIYADEALV